MDAGVDSLASILSVSMKGVFVYEELVCGDRESP